MSEYLIYNSEIEIAQGAAIAASYRDGLISGWAGPDIAEAAFKLVTGNFTGIPDQLVQEAAGKKAFLYQVCRKVLGQDTKNYPQQIGDCVSFGAKNAVEYLTCCEILLKGEREKFRPVFPPYFYGTGRLYVGGGQMGNEDGSSGTWMAEAVMKYGTLFADESNVPSYSGSVAKTWGGPRGKSSLDQFKETAGKFPVKSAAKINSWAELVAAIVNGYPCTVASNQGFQMEAGSDGFHQASGSWSHQMCFIGVDDEYSTPYALILNNWGDVHGRLKSFDGNEDLPVGVLRIKKSVAERMINAGETFAYSNFDGFPAQDIAENLFKVVGG
jgi:hypothetical protein